MAKYKAYPEYKDSGVEWLGDIPEYWNDIAIKYVVELNPSKSCIASDRIKGTCSFIPMEKLKLNSIILDEVRRVSEVYNGYTYFEDEDILMAKVTPCFENKNIAIARQLDSGVGFGSSEIYVLRCNHKVNNKFLFYRLQEDNFMALCEGAMTGAGGLKRVPSEILNNFSFALPAKLEQIKIAAFLDHETAKIDNLIEKQQQLIKLLKEKRQAVISHTVNKGLNPNVPMKDSGIELLGDIPAHWEVKRLKHIACIIDCKNRTPEYIDDGEYLVVRTTNVKKQSLVLEGALYTSERDYKMWTERGVPPTGSILFTREAPAGEICIVPEFTKLCMGQRMMNFICHQSKYTKFLFDYLTSDYLKKYIESESAGSTVSHLRVEQVYNIPVVIPPSVEQKSIDDVVGVIKSQYSKLIDNAECSLFLLQERRTALISAAVTGKIDVRDWVAPANSEMANIEASQEVNA
ncbi:restriction endonuclease subunit S [Pectobacterium punjabense]|uniref:restriction endonuclease subunit S n=1 Tax=Pectobacterium punjabense TaxID=2108399 RepID=UPI001BFF2AAE|nr:restriction endonuclease subunit S [Pectobacterium punjabense]MBT9185211.1 restriction endonuclease subunit S [Pectobacterium punjabense]